MPSALATLVIRLTRRTDGSIVLDLRRPDGTITWQRRTGPTAEFFAVHDLTHYAVETVLGYHSAFYGLVAAGWELDDFGTPWPRGPLPADALPAELIVGMFDTERASGVRLAADAFNDSAASWFSNEGAPSRVRISDGQLAEMRETLASLVGRWTSLLPGETMELRFPTLAHHERI
ncbi:MAG: hypothetical protein H0W68_10185 [Gemmatimonadaceae bacterium]|nr:hypothetical protein [Gemmatimonadaceae bacterium]